MYTLKVEGAFEAAHRVAGYPGKCDRLHGHNWVVQAVIQGTELDELGMLVDFKQAKRALSEVLERFDHRFLNELQPFSDGLNPTAENLSRVIFEELAGNSVFVRDSYLSAITVFESPKSSVTYTRNER
ncbi:6-carboxytetrahydropterin synthase QueD [Selenomonas montiformis]|uniref:6-carboxy-5,6,7,8-tetrahydropterin synthase n=1 Tax=Selenomonas montiformis TaxID=2652285 RepID=A0A6I2V1T8_9FIRM|nr:6-carboxytetrahydropterin synthase QueD [Selenomonas montiformis]MDY4697738.1 6-carboxytetrahydropterin synthase QueD [Selenomonas montiformis]MSV25422.1 6-carboxytetrahydropterin synthase QueD [Selenomonas montiformis]